MCRSVSVETLHLSHLQCADDSVGCVLHKTKTNQEGSGPKDPRHIYANPGQLSCCWVLALGIYLAANPSIASGKLFPGSNQKSRFCRALGKMLEEMSEQKVYGTHSIRKGVATYASSGSTGGPSIVSVCLHCGWSLGGVQDRYFRYEAAGDQYLGRVVAGLPLNSSEFSVLPPHFDDPQPKFVLECTASMFPATTNDTHIAPVLQLWLASIVTHASYLRAHLSAKHPMLSCYVFRNPDILTKLEGMLGSGRNSWMRPTGIPPHVELFQQHRETRRALNQLPDILLEGFSKLLEEKCVVRETINWDTLESTIRALLLDAGLWRPQANEQQPAPAQHPQNIAYHWPSDGRFHRMPEAFQFPQLDALGVWRLWWFGNPAEGYPPFRALQSSDFTPSNRKMFSEWSVLVRHITGGVEAGIDEEMQRPSNQDEADRLYHLGMTHVPLKQSLHPHKQRPERAVTTLRRIRQAIHDADPDSRSLPFRNRKRNRNNK